MKLNKLLGIGALSMLGSCGAVKETLPEFPVMSFEEKISYHTQDNHLSYEEAKDLLNSYEEESKISSDQGFKINVTDARLLLIERLNLDFPGITFNRDYRISYDHETKLSKNYQELIKDYVQGLLEINKDPEENAALQELMKKDEFTVKDAIQSIDLGIGYGGEVVIGGSNTAEKFKDFKQSLSNYCYAIRNEMYAYKDRYVSMGVIDPVINSLAFHPENKANDLEFMLEKYLRKDITIQNEAYYPQTYFGVWWGALIGLIAPIIVQIACQAYTKRKAKDIDGAFCSMNALVGLAFDCVHPSLFFIRTGAPVVWSVLAGLEDKTSKF